jgi:hypothetical protein
MVEKLGNLTGTELFDPLPLDFVGRHVAFIHKIIVHALVKEWWNRYGLAVMSNEQINIAIGGVYGSNKGNAELS